MKITTCVLLAFLCVHSAFAGLPSFVLSFEQSQGSEIAVDVLGNLEGILLSKPSHVITTDARFGNGSLLIQEGVKNTTAGYYLSSTSHSDFFGATSAMTIAAWVKLESNEGGFTLLRRTGKNAESPGSFSFGIDRRHRLTFDADGSRVRSTPFEVPVDQWFHIAATYDAGNVALYLDGVEMFRGEVTAKDIVRLEGEASFSSFLHSIPGNKVDEALFLGDRALNSDEVARLVEEPLRREALPPLP